VVAQPENDRPQRRHFSPEEKERILAEADACTERGQLGELLRREGIYSSHLSTWRAQRKAHGKEGLKRKRPGPKPTRDDRDRLIEKLQREKAKLEKELRITRSLVELQKKAHEILGIALPNPEDATEEDSSSSSSSEKRRSR
jgi:transposase-like protein